MSELQWIAEGTTGAAVPKARRNAAWAGWLVAGVLLLAVAAQAVLQARRPSSDVGVLRLSVSPPEGRMVDSISLSPDGRHLAMVVSAKGGPPQIWIRPLDGDSAQPLLGTEDARVPFWSPDSRFLGFFANRKLKRIPATGGTAETLSDVGTFPRGGTWSRDGTIVFAPGAGTGLLHVAAAGGTVVPLTTLDPSQAERSHSYPSFLPDGRSLFYLVQSALPERAGIHVLSLDSKETKRLLPSQTSAVYAPPGYLLFGRDRALVAQPFDAQTLRLTGDSSVIAPEPTEELGSRRTEVSASTSGILAYRSHEIFDTDLVWFDRTGKPTGTVPVPERRYGFSLSRDDQRLAVLRAASQRGDFDLWLHDLARHTDLRFTFDPALEWGSVWSPDGSRVVFASDREGHFDLYQKPTSGSAVEELLLRTTESKVPTDWSLDGRYIAYSAQDPRTGNDLWVLRLDEEKAPIPFLRTEAQETFAQFSPDGRFIAYMSNESGREEVYVQPFPSTGAKWQVSTGGGFNPRFRRDGKELCYLSLERRMMAVEVKTGAAFEVGPPRVLFAASGGNIGLYRGNYVMTSDGQRFLMPEPTAEALAAPIFVVVNWPAALPR